MKKTILIIDDFETTLYTVGITLETKGYSVLKAKNAEEALNYFDGRPMNLVISDYNMPGLNGMELTEKIRKKENYVGIPILILSTETNPDKKKDAFKKGATGWIQKPFKLDEFIKVINRVIK